MNRLIEFADSNEELFPPLGFIRKKIQWIADIYPNKIEFVQAQKKFELVVPDISRSSGTSPIFLVDKADYVFGIFDEPKHEKRSKERQAAYLELINDYLNEYEDEDIAKLLEIIKQGIEYSEEMKMNDLIAFRIRGDQWLHNQPYVRQFWEKRMQPKSPRLLMKCMFCGSDKAIMERHSMEFTIGRNRTKLISANKNAYESYQLNNSYIAPTCYSCEKKYGQSLDYLLQRHLDPEMKNGPHMFQIGEITYVYWVRGKQQLSNSISNLIEPDANQSKDDLKDIIKQAFSGVTLQRDLKNFCLLSLSANKARLVVRDYMEDSAYSLERCIQRFFEAQDVGAGRYYGIYTLAALMYQEASTQMKKYAIEEWMNWFLKGKPLSGKVLIPLLKQIQVSGEMYARHAVAVKSWIVSQNKGGDNVIEKEMEARLCGRLFALLEKVQKDAIGSKSTISSQYFGSASTAPRSTMGLLLRNTQNHLGTLAKTSEGSAVFYDKRIGQVMKEISYFPQTLNLNEQAEFVLGYYHEKQDLYTSQKEKGEIKNELSTNE